MSDSKKFRFVSPGIFLNEIDQSYLPAQPTVVGPVIIGRTEKGPGMIPVKVGTWSEFVNIFGNPIAGNGPPAPTMAELLASMFGHPVLPMLLTLQISA